MLWGRHRRRPQHWSRKDLALAEALQLYEDGLCGGCGMPAWMAYDPRNAGEFELRDDVECIACEQRELDDSKPSPGVKKYLVNLIGT